MDDELLQQALDMYYDMHGDKNKTTLISFDILDELTRGDYVGDTDEGWTSGSIGNLFDFIYDTATELNYDFQHTQDSNSVFIEYEGKYFDFNETHGQGTYQSIIRLNSKPLFYTSIEDILEFDNTRHRPFDVNVLEIVRRGLASIEAVSETRCITIGHDTIDLQETLQYIKNSLARLG